VALLFAQGLGEPVAKCRRRIGELQQGESHELRREQLVIGEEMKEDAPVRLVDQSRSSRERGPLRTGRGETEFRGSTGSEPFPVRKMPRLDRVNILKQRKRAEFILQMGGKKNPFGELGRSFGGAPTVQPWRFGKNIRFVPSKAGP
jgi:hypothetical protein